MEEETTLESPIEGLDLHTRDVAEANEIDEGIEVGRNGQDELVKVKINAQHFDLLKLVGEGAFGKVLLVRNRFNRQLYAMKVINKSLLRKKNNIQYMKSEREILTKLRHPFLVSLQFAFQSATKLFLVMDFLSGGELFLHLQRKGIILEGDAMFYVAEMVLALEFLHSHHIVHRDLKPENILLRGDGHICVTDFGLAKEIGDSVTTRTLCGTSEYMAPEMLTRNGYNKAVDYWALGALTYEMLTSHPPFRAKTQAELERKILSEKLSLPPYLTKEAGGLVRGLLERDATKRLGCVRSSMFTIGGVASLKAHPFFAPLSWGEVERLQVPPPLDLVGGKKGGKEGTGGGEEGEAGGVGGVDRGGSVEGEVCNFHEEFTKRVISRSLLEDTLPLSPLSTTPLSSVPPTPRALSPSRAAGETRSGTEGEEYGGFEYTSRSFVVTREQAEVFERELRDKTHKQEKRLKLKFKEDQKREEVLKLKMQEERQKKEREDRERQEREERDRERLQAEKERREGEERRERVQRHNEGVREYRALLLSIQKRAKALRKKVKEAEELEEKKKRGVSLVAEQEQKLSRLSPLRDELAALEREEQEMKERDPGEEMGEEEGEKREEGKGLPPAVPTPSAPSPPLPPKTWAGAAVKGGGGEVKRERAENGEEKREGGEKEKGGEEKKEGAGKEKGEVNWKGKGKGKEEKWEVVGKEKAKGKKK